MVAAGGTGGQAEVLLDVSPVVQAGDRIGTGDVLEFEVQFSQLSAPSDVTDEQPQGGRPYHAEQTKDSHGSSRLLPLTGANSTELGAAMTRVHGVPRTARAEK